MKEIINKLKKFYNCGDNKLYFSLFGPLLMGTIHLVVIIISYDWIILNYCIFYYLIAIFKVWQWAIENIILNQIIILQELYQY